MNNNTEKQLFRYICLALSACTVAICFMVARHFSNLSGTSSMTVFFDIAALILLSFFCIGISFTKRINNRVRSVFNLLLLVFAAASVDIISMVFQGNPQYVEHVRCCHILSASLYNSCSLMLYIYARALVKAQKKYGVPFAFSWLILNVIIYTINPASVMFTVDQNAMLQQSGWGFFFCFAYPCVCQFCGVFLTYKYSTSEKQKAMFTIFNILPLMSAAGIYWGFGINILCIAYTVAGMLCYYSLFLELERENASFGTSLQRYFSDNIVNKLSDEDSESFFVPRYHYASLLSLDVRGFTALSQHMNADHLVDMVNHGFGVMAEIIEQNGGTILEFLGDGLTAVFGAPFPSLAHEEKAVNAAIAIQNEMKNINRWNEGNGYPCLDIGIGINTGNVLIGEFGTKTKTAYKAIGKVADRAAVIQSFSVNGDVLVSENTLNGILCDNSASLFLSEDESDHAGNIYSVTVLGNPYNAKLEYSREKLIVLNQPYELNFRCVNGKQIGNSVENGMITALNENVVRIRCEKDLSKIREIVFSTPGFDYMYAKKGKWSVEGEYEFIYASKPNGFLKWIIHVLANGNYASKETQN